jgi:alkylhydroperoxidase family enzyme
MITLRAAWLYQCEYEWAHHIAFARQLGMSNEEFEAIKLGSEATLWSDFERHLLRAVDQLCKHAKIGAETWHALAEQLDKRQLMDLLFTVGNYAMLACVVATVGVELEPEFAEFGFKVEDRRISAT